MSMTKRYLESLPQAEQDAILGGIDNAYISPDEWDADAENEPTEEELAEWARALMEEDDNPKERGVDKFTERENATFGKRTPKGKREGCFDI